MKQELFHSLDDESLRLAVLAPATRQVRAQSPAVKAQVYAQMTPGQRALFMFQVLFEHSRNSTEEYYKWCATLMEEKTWGEVKGALKHLRDEAMLQFLEETEEFLLVWKQAGVVEDEAFLAEAERRNARYHELAARTIERIGEYVRSHPEEFVQWEEEA
ncbi:MAG TPA: hypothetical protein VFV52_14065 [Bacilli bacterium]|nr:hypothetical protein [Bacilli bacterium]